MGRAGRRRPVSSQLVLHADVHIDEQPADLAPFCAEPWRVALAAESGPERWLDTPGYSPLTPLDPPLGDRPESDVHTVGSADEMRADLDRRGVAATLLITGRFVGLAQASDDDYAVSIAGAYNRYLRHRCLDPARGLYGAILLPPQDAAAAAHEIEAHAGAPGVAAGLLSTVHVTPLWGSRERDRVFAAAQAHDLPLVLHGATTYGNVFPYQLQLFESPLARGALSQPLGAVANVVDMVTTGVFARHRRLRVLVCEAGLTWLPFVGTRLDGQWRHLRASAPELTEQPSDYLRRQLWVTTHPAGDLAPGQLGRLVDWIGADRVLFGSDWPHFDSDAPAELAAALPAEARDAVMGGNARRLLAT